MRESTSSHGNGATRRDAHRRWVLAAVDAFEQRLVRFAVRLLRDEEAARDVVQHAFLQLCRQTPGKVKSLEDSAMLARWLFSVARNRAMDLLRQQRKRPSLNGELADDWIGGDQDPAQASEQQEMGQLLLGLVEQLPDAQRESVLLWAEGWNSSEIGEITSRTPATVRVHLHKAFKTLRDHPVVKCLDETRTEAAGKGQR